MIFKITKRDKNIYFYKPIILGFLLDIILALGFTYYKDANLIMFLKLLLGILIGQSFLFNIPLLIFFYYYMKKDRSTEFEIENNGENFNYQNSKVKISFTENDIKEVVFHLSPPLYDERATWLYWDDYFYSEIITTKGVFKIGCLVINNLIDYINDEKIVRKKVYFPLIN